MGSPMKWKLADAKNRFSELFTQALTEGPQHIQRRGQAVVVVAEEEYLRLAGERPGFKDYLMDGPELDDLDLERDRSPMRSVSL